MSSYSNVTKCLLILTEHFAPSTGATAQLITDLAYDLSCKGVPIRVLTSTAGGASSNYKIHRISLQGHLASGILAKTLRGLHFFVVSVWWLLSNSRSYESAIIVSNPPFIGVVGLIIRLIKRKKYIFILQDIFPRSAILTGILPSRGPFVWFWKALMATVLRASDTTVVLSRSMIDRCISEFGHTGNIICIPNWAAIPSVSSSELKANYTPNGEFNSSLTVQYSGNFGRLHDILTILEAARLLQGYPITFLFIGGGAKLEQICAYKQHFKLDNISIRGYQPRHLLAYSLSEADISIVSLIPGAEDTVAPSKLYGILASSRPVLLISSQESELTKLINSSSCGVTFAPGDSVEISQYLLHLLANPLKRQAMSANSRDLYTNAYGRSKSTQEYFNLLQSLNLT